MRSAASCFAALATLSLIAGCAGGGDRLPPAAASPRAEGAAADYPMVLGDPFVVDGVTYTPADTMNYDAVGLAGVLDGAGEGIIGAHRTLPLPSYVEVTSLDSGRTILVRLEARGPMTNLRLVDLSPGAYAQLGLDPAAPAAVRVRRVNPPEVERALLRAGGRAPERIETPPGLRAVLRRKLDAMALPAAAPLRAAANTPLEPVEVGPSAAVQTAAAPPVTIAAEPEPEPEPARAEPEATPEAKPAADAKPASDAKPAADVKPTTGGDHFVQVAAFSTRARAEASAKTVGGTVSPAGSLWRVRVGPLATRAEADAALAKVRAAGYADARIVRAR